jgi:hypothetical protein
MRPLLTACAFGMAALAALSGARTQAQAPPSGFTVRSTRSGAWSSPATWEGRRIPRSGDRVQVRAGHRVTYDLHSDQAIRMLHVAGLLTFSRSVSTRLDVGLICIQPGETASEEGFNCDLHPAAPEPQAGAERPALELGTPDAPIPAGVTANIRLVYFPGMNRETLPAIVNCGGRWDVHGAPMRRTWLKLSATAAPGSTTLALADPVPGWKVGDRLLITGTKQVYTGRSFRATRRAPDGAPLEQGQSETRFLTAIRGATLTLDRPLRYEHIGAGETRGEAANLTRNVVIESADPAGVRGHTMYHLNSTGGISYAEFRHLGKENVLGKYSIHFHLVRDTMRGSGVLGASIWDSHNRWITIHGTDYLLIRDCVGYQSVGHGFFLEDGTEQYNILDRNLAVQACDGKRLPKQVLPFDPNDGAGFWWAAGRNTLTRNVSCENDHYGYHYEVAKRSNFDPNLPVGTPDGRRETRDIRTVPFLRFEDNESHTEGLYSFNFGDDVNPAVRGDRAHPFIARNLRAWETHYVLRPNLQFFLMEGLRVNRAVYGVYHPDYDAHVYRNLYLNEVISEPINRGHDDDSVQYGDFTYDGLTLENCRVGRDPLIQLTCTAPTPGRAGHFRNLTVKNSRSRAGVVDLGCGPRSTRLQHGVAYYFHGYPDAGRTLRVVSTHFPEMQRGAEYRSIPEFTGPDVRAGDASTPFPELLAPVDDLPPATLITQVRREGRRWVVRGVTQDNGEVAAVTVNNRPAALQPNGGGLVDWEVVLDTPRDGRITARAVDRAGNSERTAQVVRAR